MDSKSDTLILSYKDNPELKAAIGDAQPGDQIDLCVTVTVRANDEEKFDALIDEVSPESESEEEEEPAKDAKSEAPASIGDEEVDEEEDAPVLMVMGSKK